MNFRAPGKKQTHYLAACRPLKYQNIFRSLPQSGNNRGQNLTQIGRDSPS